MISRLSKRSGGLQALDSLSLTLDDHELVGFVGANGAGKSTTMRIVMGALAMIIVIMGGGQTIAMGVVEEKSSRIVEILLACVRPGSLLAGKILGTGVAVILGYGLIGLAAGAAAELTGVLPEALFSIDAVVVAMIVWMIVGCAIAAAAYGAAGALVSRQEDTASVTMPLTMLFMIPYMLSFVMAMDPSKTVFRVLAYLPPLSPFLMPARLVLGVSSWAEQLVALVVALAFIPLLVGLAATVYTRAVTRTGSRMRLKEVLSRETARRDHRAAPVAPRPPRPLAPRSVEFRLEIGPVPHRDRSGSGIRGEWLAGRRGSPADLVRATGRGLESPAGLQSAPDCRPRSEAHRGLPRRLRGPGLSRRDGGTRSRSRARPTEASRSRGRGSSWPSRPSRGPDRRGWSPGPQRSARWRR